MGIGNMHQRVKMETKWDKCWHNVGLSINVYNIENAALEILDNVEIYFSCGNEFWLGNWFFFHIQFRFTVKFTFS